MIRITSSLFVFWFLLVEWIHWSLWRLVIILVWTYFNLNLDYFLVACPQWRVGITSQQWFEPFSFYIFTFVSFLYFLVVAFHSWFFEIEWIAETVCVICSDDFIFSMTQNRSSLSFNHCVQYLLIIVFLSQVIIWKFHLVFLKRVLVDAYVVFVFGAVDDVVVGLRCCW